MKTQIESQKFRRGNKVRILSSWTEDKIGREAIIVGSYADLFGVDNISQYTVMFGDTGNESAWLCDDDMELIDEGGEHLLDEAKLNADRIHEQNTDIEYILQSLEDETMSGESILFLFDMIGYKSSFHQYREPIALYIEWEMFKHVFHHIKRSSSVDEAKLILNKKWQKILNVEKVFNAFNEKSMKKINSGKVNKREEGDL